MKLYLQNAAVFLDQAQIMKLSNLLLAWSSKLRIKEHDQLDACVKSVPEWESEAIMPLGRKSNQAKMLQDSPFAPEPRGGPLQAFQI